MTNNIMTQEEIMDNAELFISQTNNDIELLRSTAFDPQNDLEEFFLEEFCLTKETILSLFKRIVALEEQVEKLSAHRTLSLNTSDLEYAFEDGFNNY